MAPPTLPTYESLRESRQPVRPSADFFRLRWYLSGPLSTHVKVLSSAVDSTSPQSPYQTNSTTFHPISNSPVSDPPVSSITVTVRLLDEWAEDWAEAHDGDIDGDQEWTTTEPDGVTTRLLVRCDGEDRPGPGPSLTVSASSSSSRLFVTVHDYIMAVHPWLLALDAEIRSAIGVSHSVPLPARFGVYVRPSSLSPLRLWDEKMMGPRASEADWVRVAALAAEGVAENGEEREQE